MEEEEECEGRLMWYNVLSLAGTMGTLPVSFEDRAHPMQRCAHLLDSVFTLQPSPSYPLTLTPHSSAISLCPMSSTLVCMP